MACVRRLIPLYVSDNPLFQENWSDTRRLVDRHFLNYYLNFANLRRQSKFSTRRAVLSEEARLKNIEALIIEDLAEILSNYTLVNKYTRSMMITMKLVLQCGYGRETTDSILNMSMSTFIMIGGWLYATYVIVIILNVHMASESSENKLEEMSREIDEFCEKKKLSQPLRSKIKNFFRYKFTTQYFNDDAIKESMPANLRKEIMMHSCSNLVHKVPLFQEIPQLLLENIINCLKFEVYFPNDVIIKANTMGDSMYFLAFGTAAIVSNSGELHRNLTSSHWNL